MKNAMRGGISDAMSYDNEELKGIRVKSYQITFKINLIRVYIV